MAIVRPILLGLCLGVLLMFITELGFASMNPSFNQEDTPPPHEAIPL